MSFHFNHAKTCQEVYQNSSFYIYLYVCYFKIAFRLQLYILLTSSKNQIYEFRIPNIYNYFFNNIQLMYTLCFLVASVKLKVYKKIVKFSFKQQKIFWVLVFSFIYLVLVDAMDKSNMTKNFCFWCLVFGF